MKTLFTTFIYLFPFLLFSQDAIELSLKSGDFTLNKTLEIDNLDSDSYRLITFNTLPTESEKVELNELGIDFLYYLPKNTFAVSLENNISFSVLSEYDIVSVNNFEPFFKIDSKLKQDTLPSWALQNNLLSIKVIFFKTADFNQSVDQIRRFTNLPILENELFNSIELSITPSDLSLVSSLSFISYIEPVDPPAYKENDLGRTLHRTNVINTEYVTGKKYNGEGVKVMMHDDGYVEPHIDRKGRVDESFCFGCSSSSNDSHGDHVSGTIMGAGNLDPKGRGMADGSFLYVMGYSTNNYSQYVPQLYNNYDVVITSASYSNGCNAGYTSLARDLDEQNNTYSSLLHVFSAGNSGSSDCGYGAGSTWGNVTGGHKQAKNVIAVGNLDYAASLASSSSRGPAADGRIKPDICAQGTNVYSTYPNYTYNSITGTSMSCPGISGVLAQLYQAYKENNNNTNPSSGLMKCILLNSADDIGNPGPDFKHGWGVVNANRALKLIENSNYFSGSISQGSTNTHTLNIPSNIDEVKVMVYWHDKEGSTSASISLVNDINMSMSSSNGTNYNPWVLDPTPNSSNLNQNAVRGIDNLNNMEQVTITNPSSGNYTIYINGNSIPFGPQEYFISYELIDSEVELTYPIGGEGLVPGEYEAIRWDASESNTSFSLQYSNNNGSSWSTIANNVSSSARYYAWQVPSTVTNQALIRISRGNSVSQSHENFTVVDVPANLSVYWPCRDSINISWSSVSGATGYVVRMLGEKYMDSVYTTTSTNIWLINPDPSVSESWFSVNALKNSGQGRRAVAVNAQALSANCAGAILGCTNPTATNYDPIANTTVAYGGAASNNFGSGGYFNGDQHLIFTAYKESVIKSAIIYSEASNTITFELRDNSGTVLDDTTLNVIAGQQRIDLNFDVPIGTDLQLGVAAGALQNNGLYRNSSGASYPYDVASALTITASSASSAPLGYYYFYYDLEVEVPCLNSSNSSWDCDGQGNCYPGTGNGAYSSLSSCQSNCVVPSWDCDGQGNCYDPGTGNGAYSSLSSCQSNCVVPSWDCDGQGNCYDPGTGNGLYGSLTVCQSNCVVPSWDCDGQGNCYDPGTGNGAYSSLSSCQSNCVVPSWDCDGQGNCYDPGNGNGAYSSLSSCQSNCVVPSWDCDGQGNCYDPGNGNGAYSSLSSCQSNCIVPSWDCDDQGNCYDPGTGNGLYNTLSACQLECVKTSILNANTLDFKVYPNPSNNIFNIELNTISQESIKIKVMNTIGDIIYSNELVNYKGEYNSKIDLTQQAKGIYLLDIMTNQEIIKVKLILQ